MGGISKYGRKIREFKNKIILDLLDKTKQKINLYLKNQQNRWMNGLFQVCSKQEKTQCYKSKETLTVDLGI